MISVIALGNDGYVVAGWYIAPVVDGKFIIAILYIKGLLFYNDARVIHQSQMSNTGFGGSEVYSYSIIEDGGENLKGWSVTDAVIIPGRVCISHVEHAVGEK